MHVAKSKTQRRPFWLLPLNAAGFDGLHNSKFYLEDPHFNADYTVRASLGMMSAGMYATRGTTQAVPPHTVANFNFNTTLALQMRIAARPTDVPAEK